MTNATSVQQVRAGVGLVVCGALTAAAIPMGAVAEPAAAHLGPLSSQVVLTGDAVADLAPSAAAVFDIAGLLAAEWAQLQSMYTYLTFDIPAMLVTNLDTGVLGAINALMVLDFGDAFGDLAEMVNNIAFNLAVVPLTLASDIFEMLFVIPGDYLFNFGP